MNNFMLNPKFEAAFWKKTTNKQKHAASFQPLPTNFSKISLPLKSFTYFGRSSLDFFYAFWQNLLNNHSGIFL